MADDSIPKSEGRHERGPHRGPARPPRNDARRIEATLSATLPHLATTAQLTTGLSEVRGEIADVKVALADKPGKIYLAAAITILIAAYGLGLAGLAALPVATKLIH
jgi:hypothetical protein